MPTKDKTKQAVWSSTHYHKNKQEYYARNKAKKKLLQEYVNNTKKGKPCKDCGGMFPACVMDYDHIGEKIRSVSSMTVRGTNIKKIDEEIAKCELVCANCHRVRTYDRIQVNKHK